MKKKSALYLIIPSLILGFMQPIIPAKAQEISKNYVVIYKKGYSSDGEYKKREREGKRMTGKFTNVINGFSTNLTDTEFNSVKNDSNVLLVEEVKIFKTQETQQMPGWGLDRIDQRKLPLDNLYNFVGGSSQVDAYVIDTGINTSNLDFQGRIKGGFSAINDGNGFNDCNGHGTHVAGIIGGTKYGVNKNVNLIPVRVLDCQGSGTTTSILQGIDYILQNKSSVNPSVVNMSLGGGVSAALDQGVSNLISSNIMVVVAAGNSNADSCNFSPSRVTNALTIAASDSSDTRASFSNYGKCVDTYAPGVSITSDWINGSTTSAVLSGTSMATPFVTGAVSLLLSKESKLTPAEIHSRVVGNASSNTILNNVQGTPSSLLYSDLTTPVATVTKPQAPSNLSATPGNKSAKLTWTLNSNGGSSISSVKVYLYESNRYKGYIILQGSLTSTTITGLKSGVYYYFYLSAINSIGESSLSNVSKTIKVL